MPTKITENKTSCCGIYPFDPLSSTAGCCGSLLYNMSTQVCCELGYPTEIVDGKNTCCGTIPYNAGKNFESFKYIYK